MIIMTGSNWWKLIKNGSKKLIIMINGNNKQEIILILK